LPSGEKVGLGFTSADSLAMVFGSEQAWILVHLQVLQELLTPRGINRIQIDPTMALVTPVQRPGERLDQLLRSFRAHGRPESLRGRRKGPQRGIRRQRRVLEPGFDADGTGAPGTAV
jgi:hypothetical protein